MGLLITIYLIVWNIYGTIKAPPSRGFSYIEIWIMGMQFNILFAILEYSCVLAYKRSNIGLSIGTKRTFANFDVVVKFADFFSLIFSLAIFCIFNVIYWIFL